MKFKVRLRVLKTVGDQMVLVPMMDEFSAPLRSQDPKKIKKLQQYFFTKEIEFSEFDLEKFWDEPHDK